MNYRKTPCTECPWKRSAPLQHFETDAYRRLASTAYDMAETVFTCHMSTETEPVVCAGFLARCHHNLQVRLATCGGQIDPSKVSEGAEPLYDSYREMAVANGVDPGEACLTKCRDD